ncbi:class I SAM-dependent methyltransferase [Streptomyces sp. AJS327]|uniref:class I SAM-dependent methyltransferase n=1 Tax=Streptomyces sp. AJS327 TaxID=2545265 RepID=UPI0015DF5A8F|nr:class I SAM-dependent methyltransferase [Streptomyces sp. AJS327]MBA0050997.1 class I SAM-dependent methyltransferase [Streptomyces sp. AJS327]
MTFGTVKGSNTVDMVGSSGGQGLEADLRETEWADEEVAESYAEIEASTDWLLGYPFVFRALGLGRESGRVVLDFGCGHGKVADHVAKRYGARVLAADISPAMLEASRQRGNPLLEHHALVDDRIAGLPDACADQAMCNYVLVCVPTREQLHRMFSEVYRLLRPGGTFVVLNPDHERRGVRFDCFELGEPGVEYRPGDPMPVRLKRKDGSWFDIVDVYWPGEVYEELLREVGFRNVERRAHVLEDARGLADEELFHSREWAAERTTAPFLMFTGVK